MAKRGRPSKYSDKLAIEICLRLAEGEALRHICEDERMPAASTVCGWVVDNVEGFSERYARSKRMAAFMMVEDAKAIADDGRNDTCTDYDAEGKAIEKIDYDHIKRSCLRVDFYKWYVTKILPRVFGDKISHEVAGKDGGPLKFRWAKPGETPDDGA